MLCYCHSNPLEYNWKYALLNEKQRKLKYFFLNFLIKLQNLNLAKLKMFTDKLNLPTWIISFFNFFPNNPWFLRVCCTSLFENTVGKGEIAPDKQFLLFPQCFILFWRTFRHFSSKSKLSSADSFSLEKSKICCLGKV